jgi:hypothetical protein
MLPVFKDLANLSKKFTTKKSMPKDYVKTLKNHLDEAEGKLKQKHKVTPAELYEYTTAYHAYFIIKGDNKSEVPYHYDEKVYGVPRPALKERASKSISMGMKSMEKPKGKSRKSSRTSSSRTSSSRTSSSRTSSSSLSSKRISSPRISSSRISSPRMSKKKQTRAAKMPPKSQKKNGNANKNKLRPRSVNKIRMTPTLRTAIMAGGYNSDAESINTDAGGDDEEQILLNPENALVYNYNSSQASSLATSIVSELRNSNDVEGSRYLVRLLQYIANSTDSGITIVSNNIEYVYNRYIRSGARGAAAMTAGLAAFAVLRTQNAYNHRRRALLNSWDRGVDAISWIGNYVTRLYGLGHHLFQNFWRDFTRANVFGQYEMIKRLINVIVPIRRGWRALSALLGPSLPAIQVLVSNFASYVITNIYSLFTWLVSNPGWISLQSLTCLADLWYAAIDLLLGTEIVLNSNYAALALTASIGLLYIIQYARRGIQERGIDFRQMIRNAMDRVTFRSRTAAAAFRAKINEITASDNWNTIWTVGVDLQEKLRALDDILTAIVAAPLAGGARTGIYLAQIFQQCTEWFRNRAELCYQEGRQKLGWDEDPDRIQQILEGIQEHDVPGLEPNDDLDYSNSESL